MAQPKLEYISLALAKKIGDEVSAASTDGKIITSAQRLSAINEARELVFDSAYESYGPDIFGKMFPEHIIKSSNIGLTSNVGVKPDYCKYIVGIKVVSDTPLEYEAKRILPSVYYETSYDSYSMFAGDTTNVKFVELSKAFEIIGVTGDYAILLYISGIVPAVLGGGNPDIPEIHTAKIIDKAYIKLLTDIQRQ